MIKNIFALICIPFFFNVILASPIREKVIETPKPKRLNPEDRFNIIESQKREFRRSSPKNLRPFYAFSNIVTTVAEKARAVSPRKK